METYQVIQVPTVELSKSNKAIINPEDKFARFEHIAVRSPPKRDEAFVFSVMLDPSVKKGCIAFNISGRKWASLQTNTPIQAAPYKFVPESQCLASITFYIDWFTRNNAQKDKEFDTDEMSRAFSQQYANQAFTVGQLVAFSFPIPGSEVKALFELKVKELGAVCIDDAASLNVEIGLTTPNTVYMFEKGEGAEIRLVGGYLGQTSAPKLFSQDWDFATMGVGGLSEQFNKIFRRAFASRLLPPKFAESAGAEPVRGILLYGPPGTGKTLIARQIAKMLLAREPKIVNGPEVLNKYVGESEANIRKLFQEAEEEQAKSGINSGLHVIIFDEIDAICKSRSSSAASSGVGDSVVNQLLSKIDGVNALHNVLLIGMTNRRDLIDEALLRPGRLEVQIEIGLANEEGRLEIFKIHTKKMRDMGLLDDSVSLEALAAESKNYTGAEINGLIKAARSIAFSRVIKPDTKEITDDMLKSIKITRTDFKYAMEHDIKPALGASEDQLKLLAGPIIKWDPVIDTIQSRLSGIITKVTRPETTGVWPHYVLLVGAPNSGLTTLAANTANESKFPFIRVYQAKTTAGKTESAKVQYLEKLFDDATRSELSCIVMDGIEVILDYCRIGPRFSNTSKAVFITNREYKLPKNHRMLVICTCKYEQFLNDLELNEVFDDIIRVPSLTTAQQVNCVLEELSKKGKSSLTVEQRNEVVSTLASIKGRPPFKVGIKKLERLVQEAATDEPSQRVRVLLENLCDLRYDF